MPKPLIHQYLLNKQLGGPHFWSRCRGEGGREGETETKALPGIEPVIQPAV